MPCTILWLSMLLTYSMATCWAQSPTVPVPLEDESCVQGSLTQLQQIVGTWSGPLQLHGQRYHSQLKLGFQKTYQENYAISGYLRLQQGGQTLQLPVAIPEGDHCNYVNDHEFVIHFDTYAAPQTWLNQQRLTIRGPLPLQAGHFQAQVSQPHPLRGKLQLHKQTVSPSGRRP
ncbi:MAG: hypothetical protein OXT67_07965 [Zetaproteobacteria bacterium]|nr:hypothetical protein [Zetaproteobacteria bacterium]